LSGCAYSSQASLRACPDKVCRARDLGIAYTENGLLVTGFDACSHSIGFKEYNPLKLDLGGEEGVVAYSDWEAAAMKLLTG
jgi:hypothetical protein